MLAFLIHLCFSEFWRNLICSKKKAGVVQGQVRDRKRVKLGRVREEKEKFLSLTEFPDNLSLVSYLDYCNIFAAGRFYYSI